MGQVIVTFAFLYGLFVISGKFNSFIWKLSKRVIIPASGEEGKRKPKTIKDLKTLTLEIKEVLEASKSKPLNRENKNDIIALAEALESLVDLADSENIKEKVNEFKDSNSESKDRLREIIAKQRKELSVRERLS